MNRRIVGKRYDAFAWVVKHTNSKGRRKGPNFYDHVTAFRKKDGEKWLKD